MNLDKEAFRQWLTSKEGHEVVGVTRRPTICPVATYLQEETGQRHSVSLLNIRKGHKHGPVVASSYMFTKKEAWWAKFARTVDLSGTGKGLAVTAKQALEILDNIE